MGFLGGKEVRAPKANSKFTTCPETRSGPRKLFVLDFFPPFSLGKRAVSFVRNPQPAPDKKSFSCEVGFKDLKIHMHGVPCCKYIS